MDKPKHQGPDQVFPSTHPVVWLSDKAVKLRADDNDIAANPPVSVVTTLKMIAEQWPKRIALVDSNNDMEDVYTYKRYYESAIQVAKAFMKLGLKTFHGVGIIGFNSPQWLLSYFGSIFAGGLAAGMHPSSSDETIRCLADSAECNILVIENDEFLQRVLKIADDLPHLKAIIQYRGRPKDGFKNVFSWDEIMEMNTDDCEQEFERRLANMAPNKCCTLIATSGTTGEPKWVMLSHDNLIWDVKSLKAFVDGKESRPPDTLVSYQTLSHVSALLMDVYWPLLCSGGTIYFAKKDALKGTLIETLRKVRPTFFVGIPKVLEMIMSSVLDFEYNNGGVKKKLYSWALNVGQESFRDPRNNKSVKFKLAKHVFLRKLATRSGLDKCQVAFVGASPCKKEVLEFFLALGIPLLECYGMSEGGCIATNSKSCWKIDSVGKMIPGICLKLEQVNDGYGREVCLRGRNIFMGYLKDEEKSRKVFDDKLWFHTSDFGSLDENGMLTLAGRQSDVIIKSDSRKVYPTAIEKRILDQMPCLSYCIIVGEGRDLLNVLLVFKTRIDPRTGEPTDFLDQAALDWCFNLGINAEKLSEVVNSKDPRIAEEIRKVLERTNKEAAADKEIIDKWKILPKNFSVVGGELGVTMKLKRKTINELYKKEISEFYGK